MKVGVAGLSLGDFALHHIPSMAAAFANPRTRQ
jgi:hypothetical protein